MSEHMIPLTREHKDALELAVSAYSADIFNDDEAMAYLEGERGLDRATIADFRLGVVRDPIDGDHVRFVGRICLPNLGDSQDQHPVGVKFRAMQSGREPKYDQPAFQVTRLFNLRALSQAGDVIYVTEGEFDTIALASVGLAAVAVPGVSNWTKGDGFRARLFDGLKPILCRDSDDAATKLINPMKKSLDDLVVRSFLPHKDVNEFLINEGPDALFVRAVEGI